MSEKVPVSQEEIEQAEVDYAQEKVDYARGMTEVYKEEYDLAHERTEKAQKALDEYEAEASYDIDKANELWREKERNVLSEEEILQDSRSHKEKSLDKYIEAAKQDAEAEGVKINLEPPKQ